MDTEGVWAGQAMVDYLLANRAGAVYLVAVSGAKGAAHLILSTGQPVMAMGGFTGEDPAPTAEQLQLMVGTGEVRFVLGDRAESPDSTAVPSRSKLDQIAKAAGPDKRPTVTEVKDDGSQRTQWLMEHCTIVNPSLYGGRQTGQTLYDCRPATGQPAKMGG